MKKLLSASLYRFYHGKNTCQYRGWGEVTFSVSLLLFLLLKAVSSVELSTYFCDTANA